MSVYLGFWDHARQCMTIVWFILVTLGHAIDINLTSVRVKAWRTKHSPAFVTDSNRNSNTKLRWASLTGNILVLCHTHTPTPTHIPTHPHTYWRQCWGLCLGASSLSDLLFHCHQRNHGVTALLTSVSSYWLITDPKGLITSYDNPREVLKHC